MAIEHKLYKIDKLETFDLGKRIGFCIKQLINKIDTPFIIQDFDKTKLLEFINDETQSFWEFENEKERIIYNHKLIDKIYDWCFYDRIMIFSDNDISDNLKYYSKKYNFLYEEPYHYVETGSRYNL